MGANYKTGEMIIIRQANEKTGMVEYHTNSLLKHERGFASDLVLGKSIILS